MLSNKAYDILKYIATVFIPALVVLISSIAAALGYNPAVITAIIGAIGVFIGSLIGVSTAQYNKKEKEQKNG